jgi:hypothetical protein
MSILIHTFELDKKPVFGWYAIFRYIPLMMCNFFEKIDKTCNWRNKTISEIYALFN